MRKITSQILSVILLVITCNVRINAQANCSGWITRDSTFGVVPFSGYSGPDYRNDDGYTAAIPLPFIFCFYGTNETQFYINNNGDISFTQPYSTYTSHHFPLSSFDMLAPFWADVDTRGAGSGLVYYKMMPHYVIVQWDSVGYYGMHYDKLNSFQCIFSDGTDPIIPYGDNVSFCYRGMQWTTGDASSGVNGFDGNPAKPATVGANKGDGINYIQIGLFGVPGYSYLGQFPNAPYDGVNWLDSQYFAFNVCASLGLPPIASGVSPCDTFVLCTGDTVDLHVSFLSIKSSDSVFSTLLPIIPNGVSIISNHPANTDTLTIQLIGSSSNYGIHAVNLCSYNNETPRDSTFISFILEVDSSAVGHITASRDTICAGDSSHLWVNTNATKFVWGNNSTNDSIWVKPTVTTTYTCTLSKGKCTSTLITKTVVVQTPPTLSISQDSVCPTDSTTLTVHNATQYTWSTGATTSSIRVTLDSNTTFKVIAKNACATDTLSKRAYLVPKPVPTISATHDTVCSHGNTTITAGGGIKYTWSTGATTSSITVSPTRDSTFTVAVSNGYCAVDTSLRIIAKVVTAAIASLPVNDSICVGDSALLTASGTCTNYLWLNNSSTATSIYVKPNVNTTYSLIVTCSGCQDTAKQKVAAIPVGSPALALGKDTICSNDSTTLTASGGTSYEWLAPAHGSGPSIYVKGLTNTTFSVVVISPCYRDTLSKLLNIVPAPHLGLSGNASICAGQSTTLTASGGTTYQWSTGSSSTSTNPITLSPAGNTTYTLTVSNGNGKCKSDSIFQVTVNPPPHVTIIPLHDTICYGDSVTLRASGGGTYKWINNGSTDSIIKIRPVATATYTVYVTKGCLDSDKTTIAVNIPALTLCCSVTIAPGAETDLSATGCSSYVWLPSNGLSCTNCPSPIADPTSTTTYTVDGVDAKGCPISDTVTVRVELPCADFKVPSIFTPNNDGINDDFVINVINPSSYNINIFDRWGKLVYTSTNASNYWNGRYNGTENMVPDGVYYYTINTTCGSNDYIKKGFVEVVGEK